MKVCAIMPAFNEASNISGVIRKIKGLGIDVIVVDDGSQDDTATVAGNEGVILIHHKKRLGKGAALNNGFNYAIDKNYEIMITIDADGQHDPDEIPLFIKKAKETNSSVVIGNRLNNPTGMPLRRIFTNRLMSAIISAVCHQHIPDTQCGYRLFMKKAIMSINIEEDKFGIDSELLVKLSKKGYKIESLPIKSIYTGQTSQIRPLADGFRFIRFLIKTAREG